MARNGQADLAVALASSSRLEFSDALLEVGAAVAAQIGSLSGGTPPANRPIAARSASRLYLSPPIIPILHYH